VHTGRLAGPALDERIISIEQSAVERSLQSARASRTSAYFEVLPALDALLNHQSWISTLHSGAYLSRLGAAKAGWRGGEESGAADGHDLRMWGIGCHNAWGTDRPNLANGFPSRKLIARRALASPGIYEN
jgi:hypothetical protein